MKEEIIKSGLFCDIVKTIQDDPLDGDIFEVNLKTGLSFLCEDEDHALVVYNAINSCIDMYEPE